MSGYKKSRWQSAREAGMVSIMVTMILMIVISLIVLGFAQISRRNQRQALDRQLSTQAFYAAESGVNDVRDLINAAAASGTAVPAKTDCSGGSGAAAAFYSGLNADLDTNAGTKYTCVMVDPTPTNLRYELSSTSVIVPVISANGTNISRINLNWESKQANPPPTTNCPTTTVNTFSSVTSWQCGYGVLRFDLVPTNGSFDYAALQNRTMTSFLVPLRPGSAGSINTIGYAAGGNNNRLGINCSDANCNLSITGLSVDQYYMRISSSYKDVSLTLNATDSSGASLELQGAQAVIDSTGKARDVLRRIQVYVPLNGSSQNKLSDYALETTDAICKRFVVMDGFFDSRVNGVTSTNPLCQP